MNNLRILYVLSAPGVGGAQNYVETAVRRLGQMGYRTAVVCNHEPALVARYGPHAEVFPMPIPYGFSPRGDLQFFMRLLRLLRRERFDVVQTSAAKASLYGRLAARLAGVPVVIFRAGGFPFHSFMHPLLRWLLITMEKAMSCWCTDMVVSVSEEDQRDVVARGIIPSDRIMTIQNGVDSHREPLDRQDARRVLGLGAEVPVVGMVGRLSRQKAPDDFLRVAALVAQEVPVATFLVVGDGPMREDLERMAADLGIAGQVRFLGVRNDVPLLTAALDVFALTSLWEGVPFSILEAMAAGKPVVATAVNGVGEVVEHGRTGFLAPPQDVKGLAACITTLLRDPARARIMGQAGRRRIMEDLSIDRAMAQYSGLYQELYQAKRPDSPAVMDQPRSEKRRVQEPVQ